MRAAVALASVAVLLAAPSALAECPNSCSGHGSCHMDDTCTCYANWQAGDCSLRTCPYDIAWGDIKDATVAGRDEHFYAECSGRGVCDRQTGECVCEDNFEGEACQRLACPGGSNCNGHGTCELMSKVNTGYTGWDAEKVQLCKCDAGYTGHNCARRMCKLGDDPLTASSADQVQTVSLAAANDFVAGSQIVLAYTDWRGETWYSRAIDVDTMTDVSIKEALLTMPQKVVDDVAVELGGAFGDADKTFSVTFKGLSTPGAQPLLEVLHEGCALHGCQPYYAGVTITDDDDWTGSSPGVAQTTAATTEREECAGRGTCDEESGICKCFTGFYGEACEKQTLVL